MKKKLLLKQKKKDDLLNNKKEDDDININEENKYTFFQFAKFNLSIAIEEIIQDEDNIDI